VNVVLVGANFARVVAASVVVVAWWCGRRELPGGAVFILGVLAGCLLFHSVSDAMEWSHISDRQDVVEDYVEVLEPILWCLLFYSYLQDRARRRLSEREGRMRSILSGIGEMLFVCEPEGWILDCNETTCRSLGYSRDELLGRSISDIRVDGEDADSESGTLPSAMCDNRRREGVYRARDGRAIAVEVQYSEIEYEGRRAVLAAARDITERKKAEEKLRLLFQCGRTERRGCSSGGSGW